MVEEKNTPEVSADDFARSFPLRGGNLMWLLGAGASASAGIATAWDMIWEFKQRLYLSQRKDAPHAVADLSSPTVRTRIQSHIEASGRFPARDTTRSSVLRSSTRLSAPPQSAPPLSNWCCPTPVDG